MALPILLRGETRSYCSRSQRPQLVDQELAALLANTLPLGWYGAVDLAF